MGSSKEKPKKKKGGKKAEKSESDPIGSRIKALKDLGIPVKGFGSYKRDIANLEKKKDEDGLKKYKDELFGKLDTLRDKWVDKRIELNLEFARRCLDVLGENGEDISNGKGLLQIIERGRSDSPAEKTFDMMEELRSTINRSLSKFPALTIGEAWSSMEKSFQSYESVVGTEEKIDDAKKHFKKTIKLVEKGDLDNSLVYSNLLYTSIQSKVSDDTVKDRFKVIEEDVKGLMETMEEFKKYGLENTSMEKDLSKLEKLMKGNKISDAQTTIKRINKNVNRVEKEFFRRKGSVSILEAGDLIEEYGSLIDLKDQSKRIEKLKRDQTKMSPRKFMEESSSLLDDVRSHLFDNFEGQVTDRLVELDDKLKTVKDESDRSSIMDLREKASQSLASRDITEAMEYLSLAEEILGQTSNENDLIMVQDDYERFLSDYEILLNEDIELEELKEDITEIERMFLQDDILGGEVSQRVATAETKIKDRIVKVRTDQLSSEKDNMIGLLNTLNVPKDRMTKYESRFDELESMLSELEEDDYRERVSELKQDVDGEISNYFRDNYDDWAKEVQTSLENLRGKDLDTNELQTKLDDAGRMYRERDYLNSGQTLRSLKDELTIKENDSLIKEVEEQIDSAEFLFDEASRSGVDVESKKNELQIAKELLNKGEIKEASKLVGRIETDVKNLWKEQKRSHLQSDIEELRGFISESDQIGLDISDVGGLIDEAENLFKEDRLEEVNEVVLKAKETIDSEKNQYYSQGAMDSIKKLKDDITAFGDMGINTLESETLLIEAERLFMNEQYEDAYSITLDIREQLNLSKETYFQEQVPKELDSVMKKVAKLEVMGLDADSARAYLDEAGKNIEGGDLVGSFDNVHKAKEISDEIFKSHISLTIPETIIDVQKQIEDSSLDGLEIDDIQGMLQEAEGLFQNEDYDNALDRIERAQETFNLKKDDYYRSRYEENLDTIEDIMGKAQGIDTELDLSRDNLNMAKDAFERGDYESSHKLMGRILKFLDKSMSDKETGKRKEVVQTYFDEVRTMLMISEGENVDTTEERQLFKLAGELLEKGDFDQAEHILEGIKVSLSEKRVNMKRKLIESSIKTSEILLQNMNDMGINTDYEDKLILQLKEALRDGDLDLCDEINQKLTSTLQKNQGPVLVQKVQREISELRARIVDANRKGLDVSGAQKELSTAIELFELGDVEASQEKVGTANGVLDDLYSDYFEGEYLALRSSLQERIDELAELGIPSDDEEEVMSAADLLFKDGNTDQSRAMLEMAQIGAIAKLNSFQSSTAESYIEQITQYLSELDDKEVDTEDLIRVFEEGLELYQSGENERAISKFSSILELGEEIRTLHEVSVEKIRFDSLDRLYTDLKSIGFKGSKKITRMMNETREELGIDSPDIESIRKDLEEISKLLEKKKKPYMEKLVKTHIVQARKNLDAFSEEGVEDPSLTQLLKETGELFRNKEFDKADEIALQIISRIEDHYKKESGMQLKGEISQVKQMLTRLKTLGSNVTNAETLLTRAESALDESRIDNAEKLIRSVRQSIQEIVKRNMRETALETIEFTDAMIHYLIDNFSGITKTIKPAVEKLDTARELFKEKKFKAAKSISEEARDMVEQLDLQNIKQFLYVFRSMQAEEMERDVNHRVAELNTKGLDTTKALMLFENAKENFEKDEFDKGRQMITLARIMLSELDQQSLRDKAFDELNNAHVEILSQKKKGVSVTTAYKTYNNAKESFSMREFKKTILLAKRAHFQARKGGK